MPRSAPSRADRELLAELTKRGVGCSPYKLERWRQHGLLPRSRVEHPGGGGSRAVLDPDSVDRASCLARWSRPGLPWQLLGLALMNVALVLDEAPLRASLAWLLDASDNAIADWERCALGGQPPEDALDRAERLAASNHPARDAALELLTDRLKVAGFVGAAGRRAARDALLAGLQASQPDGYMDAVNLERWFRPHTAAFASHGLSIADVVADDDVVSLYRSVTDPGALRESLNTSSYEDLLDGWLVLMQQRKDLRAQDPERAALLDDPAMAAVSALTVVTVFQLAGGAEEVGSITELYGGEVPEE